jgi:hypothetical protein
MDKLNRFIYIYSPTKNNKDIRDEYNKYLYDFHKRFTKIKFFIDKKLKSIKIHLIGYDKEIKHKYTKFNPKKILNDIDKMPIGKIEKKSLSLYADYKPNTTIKGLGFKDKEKALYTINKIKNLDYKYQMSVINTMINRAKYHPHINDNMKEAIKIFEEYKLKIKDI